jgi:multidrug efflux system outer membrane protein
MRKPEMRGAMLAALAAVLAGCSQAPEYVRPALPVPAQWSGPAAAADQPAGFADWRSYFVDPRLKVLIAAAIEHNRDLRVATARVAEARALYGVQKADRLPTVNVGASDYAARVPGDLNMTGQPMISRRYDVNLGITAFELDFWGRVGSLREAALASYLASEQAREAFRLALIADVADAYLLQREMDQRLDLARETLKSREESLRLIGRRREVGLAGDLDVLTADGALQGARADVAALERQRATAENALRLLVGTLPEDLPPGLDLLAQGPASEFAPGMPAEVLLRRPDIQAAELALKAANANLGAARAAFFPRISLTAAFGTASAALSGLFGGGSEAWTFQPVLSLPLFDAGGNKANLDLAEARKTIAVAQYEKAIQQAFREVSDLLVAREQLKRQLDAQEAAAGAQARRLKLTDARYKGGIASYLELLDAQRDSVSAQQGVVQLRRQWSATANQLYKALAGS